MDEKKPKVEVDPSLMDRSSSGNDRASVSGSVSSDDGGFRHRRMDPEERSRPKIRGLFGVPIWVWVLIFCSLFGALLLVMDLRNRDRFVMVCQDSSMELHRGRRFPWPFGHEVMGGAAYQPVALPARADCRSRVFVSQPEATRGFLEFVLARVRAELELEQGANLKQARRHTLQALMLSRGQPQIREEANQLLAQVDYREGRNSLARVESELRTALSRFREAKKLDGPRHKDLSQWITHLELLLASIAPTPGPLLVTGKPPEKVPVTTPDIISKNPKKPSEDAGIMPPDAGITEADPGGILL